MNTNLYCCDCRICTFHSIPFAGLLGRHIAVRLHCSCPQGIAYIRDCNCNHCPCCLERKFQRRRWLRRVRSFSRNTFLRCEWIVQEPQRDVSISWWIKLFNDLLLVCRTNTANRKFSALSGQQRNGRCPVGKCDEIRSSQASQADHPKPRATTFRTSSMTLSTPNFAKRRCL